MLDAAIIALENILVPMRLLFLFFGVLMGLALGAIPGLGGLVGLAILLPFTFDMDPYMAFAIMIGLIAVTSTSDTIPSVLFGVPGTSAAQATILDGHPMAKKGEAGRAFGAAYTASLLGGLFGAMVLALSIPILRPIVLAFGSPEFFMMGILGISMVAVLSGNAPVKGLIAGGLGLAIGMIGMDPQTGVIRWSFGQLYLWDGLPLVPVALGIFAIPEIVDLVIKGTKIADVPKERLKGVMVGIHDVVRHWFLMLRCSLVGVWVGFMPGLGASVVDWFAYGHAMQTEKGARESFGKGDVRGVIAPESANDSKDGGDYMTTLLLGFPQGTATALFIAALLAFGYVPGPEMLRKNSDVIFSIVWTMAIANLIGTAIGFGLANQLAKIAQLRYGILVSLILTFVILGGFNANRDPLDLLAVVSFGFLGYSMWRLGYPRPALILGLILGTLLERYLYRSVASWGFSWLAFPPVIVLLVFTLTTLAFTLWARRGRGPKPVAVERQKLNVRFQPRSMLTVFFLAVFVGAIYYGWDWPLIAKLMPVYWVAIPGAVLATLQLGREVVGWQTPAGEFNPASQVDEVFSTKLDRRAEIWRTVTYFAWFSGGAVSVWLLGMSWGLPLWVFLLTRLGCGERWHVSLLMAVGAFGFMSGIFEYYMDVRWPPGLLFQ